MSVRIDPALYGPGGQAVLKLLGDAGHRALVVGGPVRNALLGAPVRDIDIATDAHPKQVLARASDAGVKAVPTGIEHGTVTLVVDHQPVEVTTFRKDVATDGRRAVVSFGTDLFEDAARRDFTMNALYADAAGEVQDPLGGLPDLQARRVRFIGTPEARIREDYLRILRFFRFLAWYGDPGAGPDAEGLAACAALAEGLDGLSRERVGMEMLKLLEAPDPGPSLGAMAATGILGRVLPGATLTAVLPLLQSEDTLGLTPGPIRRLAALGGSDVAARLRLSKADARALAALAEDLPPGEAGYRLGAALGRDHVLLHAAAMGQPPDQGALAAAATGADAKLPLRAADLPHLEGPALGAALKSAEARWIASGFALTKAELIAGLG